MLSRELEPYFSSLASFRPIRRKAKAALRSTKDEKTRDILFALSQVSTQKDKFLQSLKETLIRFDSQKVQDVVLHLFIPRGIEE